MSTQPLSDTETSQHIFQAIVPSASQSISTSGASTQSTQFSGTTTIIRIFCTQDTFIAFGSNPTANTSGSSLFMPGGIVEYFGVTPSTKIAVIQSSMSGTVYCTEGH